jgi:hypothetical protein
MNFPQFWARGESGDVSCWRWSSKSLAEAQVLANQAAEQLAERFRHGDLPQHRHGYYPNRPFREQILQEVRNLSGEVVAIVTRNSYGCQVLNTARVMFIDVDLPEPQRKGGLLSQLFSKPKPAPLTNPQDSVIAKAEAWTRNHPEWGWRAYRTRAGVRLLATHTLFEPEVVATDGVFDAVGADPLYRQLCSTQKCFRARLTPKPWRCGVYRHAERWPWLSPKAKARFMKWEALYESKSREWAACESICKIGNSEVHPDVTHVLALHDEATRATSKLQLA